MSEQTIASSSPEMLFEPAASSAALASSGQRLGNYCLDTLFYLEAMFLVGMLLGVLGLVSWTEGVSGYVLAYTVLFLYFAIPEALSGRTPAKLITATKAVGEDGSPLTVGQAVGRALCRFIPFEPFSFLGGNGRPRGWHDRIPKTKVISLRKA